MESLPISTFTALYALRTRGLTLYSIGKNLTQLIAPNTHTFCVQKDRCYYVRTDLYKLATSVARINLLSLGTCLGKFTKTGKFKLHVTALDVIAPFAIYKVWIKPNGEMSYCFGNNVVKAHVGRISEETPEHQGCVIYNMADVPLVRLLQKVFQSWLTHTGIWSHCKIHNGNSPIRPK